MASNEQPAPEARDQQPAPSVPTIALNPSSPVSSGNLENAGSIPLKPIKNSQLRPPSTSRPSTAASIAADSTPGPARAGFPHREGIVGGGSNTGTTVDVVAIPYPGADHMSTWTRDYNLRPSFDNSPPTELSGISRGIAEASLVHPAMNTIPSKLPLSWILQGIKKRAKMARILLYQHAALQENTQLSDLADDLLRCLQSERASLTKSRPLFFICHGVGGLVVKLAMAKASRNQQYTSILNDCYGISFFATPHLGSSYLWMRHFAPSIQKTLGLSDPFPPSLSNQLDVNYPLLLSINNDFKLLSSEMRIWTFYETQDTQLSGARMPGAPTKVHFNAPITSIKSAILNVRQEQIYPLLSTHANCASFGSHNVQTMKLYLKDLGLAIGMAHSQCSIPHCPLELEQKVNIEVHGFYTDESSSALVRPWSTLYPLSKFLEQGLSWCLSQRLEEVHAAPTMNQFLATSTRGTSLTTTRTKFNSYEEISPPPKTKGPFRKRSPARNPRMNPISILKHTEENRRSLDNLVLNSPTSLQDAATSPDGGRATTQREPVGHAGVSNAAPLSPTRVPSPDLYSRSARRASTASAYTPPINEEIEENHYMGPHSSQRPSDKRPTAHRRFSEHPFHSSDNITTGHMESVSESARSQDSQGYFSLPDPKQQRFVWMHLQYTNPAWVKKVFDRLSVDLKSNFEDAFSHEHWSSRHARGRHSQHHACFVKPAFGHIPSRDDQANAQSPNHAQPRLSANLDCVYLFIPYLHFDSYKCLVRRREMIKARLKHQRTRPVPPAVSREPSAELRVIWEYLGHDLPINCRRTLDQYGYPSLHDTRARDDDQMLYKMTKERFNADGILESDQYEARPAYRVNTGQSVADQILGDDDDDGDDTAPESDAEGAEWKPLQHEDVLDGNVLMVDQLWMWVIDSKTVITFFPKRESNPAEGPMFQQADLRDSIFNEVNADLTRNCENGLDLAALCALHAVTVLMEKSSHPDLEIFRIFEEAVSILTERLTTSLKRFRTQGFRDKAVDYEDLENKTSSIRARHKKEGDLAEKANRDNTSAMLELRDIEDELTILMTLFKEQKQFIEEMRRDYENVPNKDDVRNGLKYLDEALHRLDDYNTQAETMKRRVHDTREDFEKLLQMVQRQAQVDEVRLSRLQADLTSAQSRSVMIFTTFTVIFLPLSFFTSLFGMNTREWGGGDNMSLRLIGWISLPASVFLIASALVVAWSTRVRHLFKFLSSKSKKAKEETGRAVRSGRERVLDVMSLGDKVQKHRESKREKKQRRMEKERLKGTFTHDFWDRHRMEREMEYRIPAVNRKSISQRRAKARAQMRE